MIQDVRPRTWRRMHTRVRDVIDPLGFGPSCISAPSISFFAILAILAHVGARSRRIPERKNKPFSLETRAL